MLNGLCIKCGAALISLPSTNQRMCSNGSCLKMYEWKLKEGQPSPWIDNKVGGRE